MSLSLVPDHDPTPEERLDSQIAALSDLVEGVLLDESDGGSQDKGKLTEHADALAKLVGALARLIEAKNKRENTVTAAQLQRFIHEMSQSINAHVASPEARTRIERDWRQLIKELGS